MDDGWDDSAWNSSAPQSNDNWGGKTQEYTQSNWRDSHQNSDNRPRRGGRGGGGGNWGNRGPRNDQGQGDGGEATSIKVPSRFVGRIIGKGGAKINDLQFESGARIQVTKDTEGDETIVRLSGDAGAVAKAEELIRDLCVDREERSNNRNNRNDNNSNNFGSNSNNWGGNSNNFGSDSNNFGSSFEQQDNHDEAPKVIDWQAMLREADEASAREWAKLPPIKKEFYIEHPEVTAMTEEEANLFREQNNNISVDRTFKKDGDKPIPKPCVTFEHAFEKYPEILTEVYKAGFTRPSPIQSQAWPVLLSGEDLIGIAQTGTGKTLAFLLPAMIHIDGQVSTREERQGPAVLVMAPTRELALQIDKEVKKYEYRGISAVCIYGGGNRREQINVLTKGVDIVIATPGRLNDLMDAGHLNVQYVTYVVLDEADRMLDMGFEPQIRKVMYSIRPSRQTVMTSATWPPGVRRLAQSYMDDPVQIYVGSLDLAAVHTVTQLIEIMPDDDSEKMRVFVEFARALSPDEKVIVFCGKKSRADELSSEMALLGVPCQTMHGDREQSDREQALMDIANGTVQILVATDVASRGLDIDDITHVVNYDFPRHIEEYVHRVGRTGRAGKSGNSISYFTRGDWAQAAHLIPILEEAQQFVPEEIYKMAERHTAWKEKKDAERPQGGRRLGGGGGRGGGGRPRW